MPLTCPEDIVYRQRDTLKGMSLHNVALVLTCPPLLPCQAASRQGLCHIPRQLQECAAGS